MKKSLKMILYFFLAIFGLIVGLVVFLYVYYSVLEKRQIQTDKELETRLKSINVPEVPLNQVNPVLQGDILNLIPVPQNVRFTGGNFVFPQSLVYVVADSLKNEAADYLKMIPETKVSFSLTGENIQFKFKKEIADQGYILDIRPGKIIFEFSSKKGL
jgi:hypothetical protein